MSVDIPRETGLVAMLLLPCSNLHPYRMELSGWGKDAQNLSFGFCFFFVRPGRKWHHHEVMGASDAADRKNFFRRRMLVEESKSTVKEERSTEVYLTPCPAFEQTCGIRGAVWGSRRAARDWRKTISFPTAWRPSRGLIFGAARSLQP